MSHRVIEVLDDGHIDAGVGQPCHPLIGMEQQRWRRAGQDLVGMVVERDDARVRLPLKGLADEVVQQVDVPLVQAVEDADDREDRAVLGAQPVDARHDVHHAPTDAGRSPAPTRTLSGARRPAPAGTAIATSRPAGSTRR